jgi:uncharacterized membrane protein YidH (DUF202 family)
MPRSAKRVAAGTNYMEKQTFLSMERTLLSKERTILSFMQTGIAFIGIGIAIINVFISSAWSVFVGSVLLVIGFIEVLESYRRLSHYRKKMMEIRQELGRYAV